ncbi:MAG: alpha/beta hydrolase [Proteobacteria bacterium]|nr:alpha/beta hydrolase [Pseudomonadota bacterium]
MSDVTFITGWSQGRQSFLPILNKLTIPYTFITPNSFLVDKNDNVSEKPSKYYYTIEKIIQRKDKVVGWSMGGMIALELAINNPKEVTELYLFSTTACFCSNPAITYGIPKLHLKKMIEGLSSDRDAIMSNFISAAYEGIEVNKEEIYHSTTEFNNVSLINGLNYLMNFNVLDKLHEIKAKTFIFHSTDDRIIDYQAALLLNERIPISELITYKSPLHASQFLAVDAILEKLNK